MTSGYRNDTGKPRWDLLPHDATEQVVMVLTVGANKYDARNWENGMAWSRCFGSMMRHSWRWLAGEDRDPETGLLHMAHAACNAMFLASYALRPQLARYDDRPRALPADIADPLEDCVSCAGKDGYHRTPCAVFEVARRQP